MSLYLMGRNSRIGLAVSFVENNPSYIEAANPQPAAHKSPTCCFVGTELHVCVYLKCNLVMPGEEKRKRKEIKRVRQSEREECQ